MYIVNSVRHACNVKHTSTVLKRGAEGVCIRLQIMQAFLRLIEPLTNNAMSLY